METTLILVFTAFVAVGLFIFFRNQRRPRRNVRVASRRLNTAQGEHVTPAETQVEVTSAAVVGRLPDSDEVLGLQPAAEAASQADQQEAVVAEASPADPQQDKIVMLHVMAAKNRPYRGYELLQALLSAGLRYGKMQIFHRYEDKAGRGPVLFSLASVQNPGTFELQKMGGYECPGLTLFMHCEGLNDPRGTFDLMLETALQFVDDLGGEVWDERRNRLTKDKIQRIATEIDHFEQAQSVPDLFA